MYFINTSVLWMFKMLGDIVTYRNTGIQKSEIFELRRVWYWIGCYMSFFLWINVHVIFSTFRKSYFIELHTSKQMKSFNQLRGYIICFFFWFIKWINDFIKKRIDRLHVRWLSEGGDIYHEVRLMKETCSVLYDKPINVTSIIMGLQCYMSMSDLSVNRRVRCSTTVKQIPDYTVNVHVN